jgi:hypothetical protein
MNDNHKEGFEISMQQSGNAGQHNHMENAQVYCKC